MPDVVLEQSRSRSAPNDRGSGAGFLSWCVVAAMLTFACQLWLFWPVIRDYVPTGDELALVVASTKVGGPVDPSIWFTQGYHFYFQTYVEWQTAHADFLRPLANVLFWLNYQLFGSNWGSHLVVGYLTHSVMVGLSGYVAYRVFRLNRWLSAMVMLIAFLNPVFWMTNDIPESFSHNTIPELIQYPLYQTEILCALLMLLAFLAFINRRFVLFALVATLALALKETALPVPIAALMLTGVWRTPSARRSALNFAWLVSPLLIWCLVRFFVFDFGRSLHTVYVFDSGTPWDWLLKPLRNLLLLPSVLYRGPLADTQRALSLHDFDTLALHGFELAANAAWWLAIAYASWRAVRIRGTDWLRVKPMPWVAGLLFALGNLGMILILQAPVPRLAYFWFTLGPAAIFASFSHRRHMLALGLALGACLVVPQLWWMMRSVSAGSLQSYHLSKQAAKTLTALLGDLPASVGTVYLLDDVILHGTAPEYLARFAGFRGRLIVVNSIEPVWGCSAAASSSTRYQLTQDPSFTRLDYRAPGCFYQISEAPPELFHGNEVVRGPWMTYRYPEMTAANKPGEHWSASVRDPACEAQGACVWLGLNLSRLAYERVKPDDEHKK